MQLVPARDILVRVRQRMHPALLFPCTCTDILVDSVFILQSLRPRMQQRLWDFMYGFHFVPLNLHSLLAPSTQKRERRENVRIN